MKNCIYFEAQIPEYLDGELTEAERAEFEAHLEGCTSCQKALEETRALFADIKCGAQNVPAELKKNVMAAVSLEKRAKKYSGRSLIRTLGGVAACLAVVIGVVAAFPHFMQEERKLIGSAEVNDAAAPQYSAPTSNGGASEVIEEEIADEDYRVENKEEEPTEPEAPPETELDGATAGSYGSADKELADEALVGSAPESVPESADDSNVTEMTGNSKNESSDPFADGSDSIILDTTQLYSESVADTTKTDLGLLFMTKGAAGIAELIYDPEE